MYVSSNFSCSEVLIIGNHGCMWNDLCINKGIYGEVLYSIRAGLGRNNFRTQLRYEILWSCYYGHFRS